MPPSSSSWYDQFSRPEYYCGDFAYRPGPDDQGYRDFEPANTIWTEYIASKRPQSVLDLGCLPAGSTIMANPKATPIETIEAGDRVLTHSGQWKEVTERFTRHYEGEMLTVRPRYCLPVDLTPEHPVLAAFIERRFKTWKGTLSPPIWIEARDLKPGMAVALPIPDAPPQQTLEVRLPSGRMWRRFIDILPVGQEVTVESMTMAYSERYSQAIHRNTCIAYLSKLTGIGVLQRLKCGHPTWGHPQRYLVLHKPQWASSSIAVTADLLRLFGYYVGDGCAQETRTSGRIAFGFSSRELRYVNDVSRIAQEAFGLNAHIEHRKNVLVVTFYRKGLARFFLDTFGHTAKEKRIPDWFWGLKTELLSQFMTGLVRADGHVERQRIAVTTVSHTLAMQLQLLIAKMGTLAAINQTTVPDRVIKKSVAKGGVRYDVRWPRAAPILLDSIAPLQNRSFNFGWFKDNYAWVPIREVSRRSFAGSVFNLKVAEDESFYPGFIVHNCGWGFLVRRLRQRGIPAWGIDISSVAMERAPDEVKPYLCRGNIADLACLPEHFPSEFDITTSFGTLEHLTPEDVDRCCREIQRVSQRGIHAIGLSTEWGNHMAAADRDKTHCTMRDYAWWRARLPEPFEVWEGSQETWEPVTGGRLKVLVIAPSAMPVGGLGYGGIERLACLLSRELARRGLAVSLAAPTGSRAPWGVSLVESGPASPDFINAEYRAFHILQPNIRSYNVALDLSHSKWTGRIMPWHTRTVNPIWHAPEIQQPPVPRWNITALSRWQAQMHLARQGGVARVLDVHMLDDYQPPDGRVGDRFLVVGKVNQRKGVLEAIRLCLRLGVGLDIVGLPGEDPQYNQAVFSQCTGLIQYLGELPYHTLLDLAAVARALLYPSQEPEAHSHKSVDVLGVGCPCITWDNYAYPEVVEHGKDGYCAASEEEFVRHMAQVDKLDRTEIARRARARWGASAVGDRLVPLLVSASQGDRW